MYVFSTLSGIVRLSNKEVSQARESFDKAIAVSPLEDVDVVISAAHSFRFEFLLHLTHMSGHSCIQLMLIAERFYLLEKVNIFNKMLRFFSNVSREHGNMADAERYYRLAVERQPNVSAGEVVFFLHMPNSYHALFPLRNTDLHFECNMQIITFYTEFVISSVVVDYVHQYMVKASLGCLCLKALAGIVVECCKFIAIPNSIDHYSLYIGSWFI